jgi:aryl-alcohol dehydrogenase-like predicted oxidoreductase
LKSGEIFDHLRTLQTEGKIRRFGASVESMEEALICLEHDDLASLQVIFNIFRQKPIDTLFAKAKERGVALIVRLPLASGLLAGGCDEKREFPENDHRNYNRDGAKFNVGETFAGLPYATGVELAREVADVLPPGVPMAQAAIRWCLDHDAVTVVIPGARSPEQVRSNAAASDLAALSSAVHKSLRTLYKEYVHSAIRGPY